MESAFGIEHGEIEKFEIPGLARLGGKIAGKTTQLGTKARVAGGANMAAGKTGLAKPQIKAGGALKKLGAGMAAHPTATGGAAIGGAAAGTGFLANAVSNRRRF